MTDLTVAIPTRGRCGYLDVTLGSIAPQAAELTAEIVVVLDGPDPASAEIAARYGARTVQLPEPRGANAARNAAFDHSDGDLVVLCDDDVEAPPGWLAAFMAAAETHPDHEVFGGPIRAWLDHAPPHCGREPAPISTLDLGDRDHDCAYVWSANMAVRRRAFQRVGRFAEGLVGRGEEEEWLDRLHADGGRVLYVADAGLVHRRVGADARLSQLARAQYHLGHSARANDVRKGAPPTLMRELRDLAGAVWHTVARRCAYGAVFAAHAVGRIRETLEPTPAPPHHAGDFISGESGYVAGRRAVALARIADATTDLASLINRRRLIRDAAEWAPRRCVQVLALERADAPNILDAALTELQSSRHQVSIARADAGSRGRFENLNRLLAEQVTDLDANDWLLVIDDDVALPAHFLDTFLFLAERFELMLAQPAHRRLSHAAWPVTRRRGTSAVRETAFVEIGPLVAFRRPVFEAILPFPDTRIGWGVDAHWGALAARHGWRIGVVDATAITHALRPIAASYDHSAALAESRAFLAAHPHITPAQAARTLKSHHRW